MRRRFNTGAATQVEAATSPGSMESNLDPALVSTPSAETQLMSQGILPIGSRRRRVALASSAGVPFEQLPYQCFQEARKILQADRIEKLKEIEVQRARLVRLQATQTTTEVEARQKQNRVASMQRRLLKLKILADINDPLIKKRFEDGEGENGALLRTVLMYLSYEK